MEPGHTAHRGECKMMGSGKKPKTGSAHNQKINPASDMAGMLGDLPATASQRIGLAGLNAPEKDFLNRRGWSARAAMVVQKVRALHKKQGITIK